MTETIDVARLDELTGRVSALAAELAELITAGTIAAPDTAAASAGAGAARGGGLDAARVSQLGALETLKSAACAMQAQVASGFADSQRDSQLQAGVPGPRAGRGIGSQIGLARRESPHRGKVLLGLAHTLVQEMPCTLAALARGELNEWRATLIARETAVLSSEHRAAVDRELCGPSPDDPSDPGGEGCPAASMGDAAIARAARAIGQRLDPGAAWKRAEKAERRRCVTIRPAPDCMVRFSALLPVVQGVGVYAALSAAADTAIALGQNARLADPDSTGDEDETPLGRGALMADELVARVLGRTQAASANPATSPARAGSATGEAGEADPPRGTSSARTTDPTQAGHPADEASPATEASPAWPLASPADPASSASSASRDGRAEPAGPPNPFERRAVREPAVEIQLIMTDWTLFGLDDEPAHLTGYGPLPAPLARRIATGGAGAGEAVRWIRRLYRQPDTGNDNGKPGTGGGLIAMDSRKRLFPAAISRFIVARDQFCRTPWCDALIRHIDHVNPAAGGGPTSIANAQGLCQACNHAKQAPGWEQTTGKESNETGPTITTTPTGQITTTTPTGHRYVSRPPSPPHQPDSPDSHRDEQAA